jgi:hypothetical protein
MPVRPLPLEIHCPECGWRQVWQPASDALTATGLPPERCPRCHADLLAATEQVLPVGGVKEFLLRQIPLVPIGDGEGMDRDGESVGAND